MDTDPELWRSVLAGRRQAFGIVFDRHRDRVFRHLLWLGSTPSDAEDLSAAVFLELWRRRSAVHLVDASLLPWLLATASNVFRNAARARRRYRRLLGALPSAPQSADPAQLAEERVWFSERAAPLAQAIRALPIVDQQLLSLTALEGYSLEQASEALGLSYGAAKTRLSRARGRLGLSLIDPDPIGAPS